MNKNDKIFIASILTSIILVSLIIIENTALIQDIKQTETTSIQAESTKPPEPDVDMSGIRKKLKNAGLVPREAKYWKKIE